MSALTESSSTEITCRFKNPLLQPEGFLMCFSLPQASWETGLVRAVFIRQEKRRNETQLLSFLSLLKTEFLEKGPVHLRCAQRLGAVQGSLGVKWALENILSKCDLNILNISLLGREHPGGFGTWSNRSTTLGGRMSVFFVKCTEQRHLCWGPVAFRLGEKINIPHSRCLT